MSKADCECVALELSQVVATRLGTDREQVRQALQRLLKAVPHPVDQHDKEMTPWQDHHLQSQEAGVIDVAISQSAGGSFSVELCGTAGGPVTSVRLNVASPERFYRLRLLTLTSLRLRPLVLEPSGIVRLDWVSLPGTNYAIEMTQQLVPPSWQKVATVTATSLVTTVRVPLERPNGFYRTRAK